MDTGVYDDDLNDPSDDGSRFTFNIAKHIDDFKNTTERQLRINKQKSQGKIIRNPTVEKSRF